MHDSIHKQNLNVTACYRKMYEYATHSFLLLSRFASSHPSAFLFLFISASHNEGECPMVLDNETGQCLLPYNGAANDFKFDRCFDQNSSQEMVFDEVHTHVCIYQYLYIFDMCIRAQLMNSSLTAVLIWNRPRTWSPMMYTHSCICTYTYIYIFMCMCICIYLCIHLWGAHTKILQGHIHVHIVSWLSMYVWVYIQICINTSMYIHVCTPHRRHATNKLIHCDMPYTFLARLIHMWHDSFVCADQEFCAERGRLSWRKLKTDEYGKWINYTWRDLFMHVLHD